MSSCGLLLVNEDVLELACTLRDIGGEGDYERLVDNLFRT